MNAGDRVFRPIWRRLRALAVVMALIFLSQSAAAQQRDATSGALSATIIAESSRADFQGTHAQPGWTWLSQTVELRNRTHQSQHLDDPKASFELIEDGLFPYVASRVLDGMGKALVASLDFGDAEVTRLTLVFAVPATHGALRLVLNEPGGETVAAAEMPGVTSRGAGPAGGKTSTTATRSGSSAPQSTSPKKVEPIPASGTSTLSDGGGDDAVAHVVAGEQAIDRAQSINPDGEEINAAAAVNHSWQIGGHTFITDGVVDDNYNIVPKGEPVLLGFDRPYTIKRLRVATENRDGARYTYRIEGSLDGENWTSLVDNRASDPSGIDDIAVAPARIRMLRITGLSGTMPDSEGYFYIREIEAYTSDPVPKLGKLISSTWVGGQVVATSDENPDVKNAVLIDNDPQTFWYAEGVAHPTVTLGFHETRTARISALMFYAENHYTAPVAKARPTRIEVSVSRDTPSTGFVPLAEVDLNPNSLVQYIDLPPTEARYVKVTVLANRGGKQTAIGDISLFEAPATSSILDDYYVRAEKDAGLGVEVPGLNSERNIAAAVKGGRVVSFTSGGQPVPDPGALIDDYAEEGGLYLPSLPSEITLHFFRERAALVNQVNFYNRSGPGHDSAPKEIVLESSMSPDGPFQQIGPSYIMSYTPYRWFIIRFAPRKMRYLRMRILSRHGQSEVDINEIQVIATDKAQMDALLHTDAPDVLFAGSRNIAHQALGGSVTASATSDQPDWPLSNLNDGLTSDAAGIVTPSFGWTTKEGETGPVDLVFSFADEHIATLVGLSIDPYVRLTRPGGPGGFNSDFYGEKRNWPRDYEVFVSTSSRDGPWTKIGRTEELLQRGGAQTVQFAKPVEAKFVRLHLLRNYGGNRLQLGEVSLYEAPAGCGASVAAGRTINLTSPKLGGAIVRFDSQRHEFWATHLIDQGLVEAGFGDRSWAGAKADRQQSLTFAFARTQAARFDRIEILVDPNQDPGTRPTKVKVETSTDRNPLKGYHDLGNFALSGDGLQKSISFDTPQTARFVRLTFPPGHDRWPVVVKEITIIETKGCDTYQSVTILGRKDIAADASAPSSHEDVTGTVSETEPNDTIGTANVVAVGQRMTGSVSSNADLDYFAIGPNEVPDAGMRLLLDGDPTVRAKLTVLPDAPEAAHQIQLAPASTSKRMVWRLPRGSYHVRVSKPPTSTVLLFDTSGSMAGEMDDLRKAAESYVKAIGPNEQVALVKFDDHVVVMHDFSADAHSLISAIGETLVAGGNTSLYDGMSKALDMLKDRPGDKAVVLLSDGTDTSSQQTDLPQLWRSIADTGARLFTIALGQDLKVYGYQTYGKPGIGTSSSRLMDFWSRATGGASFFAPDAKELANIYSRVSTVLHSAPRYALSILVPKPDGHLRVEGAGSGKAGLAGGNVELILDASGSMAGRNSEGKVKMQVAKSVMRTVINELSDRTNVALRIYGRNAPSKPKRKSCLDTELVAPFGPLDRRRLINQINATRPRGQTPIGISLLLATKDFEAVPGRKIVVLITDGIETCNPGAGDDLNPRNIVHLLKAGSIDFRLNIVGFDIGDSKTRQFLEAVASEGDGRYFSAGTTGELIKSLRRSLAPEFAVLDAANHAVAHGQINGSPVALPEGDYRVAIDGGKAFPSVPIRSKKTTRIRPSGSINVAPDSQTSKSQ